MLIRLIYRSKVSRQVRLSDAEKIAETAAARNAERDVTGVLLYTPTYFIQVLEGESAIVHGLLSRIERDPRHREVEVIAERPIEERQFGSWGMRIGMPRKDTSAPVLAGLDEAGALSLLRECLADHEAPGE